VLERAAVGQVSWSLPDTMSDQFLEQKLFGKLVRTKNRKMPDFEYVHQEMARNGVTPIISFFLVFFLLCQYVLFKTRFGFALENTFLSIIYHNFYTS